MNTLSLAMIVRNEAKTIDRILTCAAIFCDELIVVDTGSSDDTAPKAAAMGAKVYNFTWIDDFAAARNFAFSKCTKEWIIWLDGDDVISSESQEKILELKRTLPTDLEAIYLTYIYPPFQQWRERIIRRDLFGTKLFWRGPVHEYIHGICNDKAKFIDFISVEHDPPAERNPAKKDRNLSIIRKAYTSGSADDHLLYLYAIECLHSLYKVEGEQILDRFFSTVESPYMRYEILIKMYNFYIYFGEPKRALEALSKAIMEDPTRAEAYYKLGKHVCDKIDQPGAAISLLLVAGMATIPSYGTPEAEAYSHGPWEALSRVYFRLEKIDAAREMASKALSHTPAQIEWLTAVQAFDLADRSFDELPSHWQEWVEGNLARSIPRWSVIRVLEENEFTPRQIVGSLELFDQKTKARA